MKSKFSQLRIIINIIILISTAFTACSKDMIILFNDAKKSIDCDPSICPASTSVYAGTTIGFDIQNADPSASDISWQVLNSPGGEIWDPPAQNAITEDFTPFIIGIYNMQVSYSLPGNTCTCDFDLDVQLDPTQFRIELTWDGTGDLDFHLNSPSMSDPMTEDWQTDQDCYFDNQTPSWGASLDVDNVDAFGPENIVLDKEVAPSGGYHIGVLNFSGGAGRVATVKIYCGSTGAPEIYDSRALQDGEFWVVGTIDSDTCNFNYINDYR